VVKRGSTPTAVASGRPAVGAGSTAVKAPAKKATPKGKAPQQDVDPEMAEIESILKNRGIS